MINEPFVNLELAHFCDELQNPTLTNDDVFERMVNYHILYQYQPDAFENIDTSLLEAISVGGSDDLGQDGIAIRVNDTFITSKTEIDNILSGRSGVKLKVELFFIQSKNKPNTDCGELLKFTTGIKEFFKKDSIAPMNEHIKETRALYHYIINDKFKYLNELPIVRCYFVSTGKVKDDLHRQSIIEDFCDTIKKQYAQEPIFQLLGAEELVRLIKDNKSVDPFILSCEGSVISFRNVENVTNSCLAVCKASDLMEALKTEDGLKIRKSVFNDNVRDYQGDTTVNQGIVDTIQKTPERFVLYNNGITIVCEDFIFQNQKLRIEKPQIVNGCQTCNSLFSIYQVDSHKLDNIYVSIKLIATKDWEISSNIVKSTNKQNIVYEEAFETLRLFHQHLEDFALSYPIGTKIYYERRSKQYRLNDSIGPNQKFTFKNLIQASTAMLMQKPHMAHLHESVLLKEFKDSLFTDEQSLLPYYVAMQIYLQLETKLRKDKSYAYYTYKWHIMMLYLMVQIGTSCNLSNKKTVDKTFLQVLDNMKDVDKYLAQAKQIFKTAKTIWVKECGQSPYGFKDIQAFTTLIKLVYRGEQLEKIKEIILKDIPVRRVRIRKRKNLK